MNLKRILITIGLCIALIPSIVNAKEPEITATSGVVIDCIDGKIL